MSELIGNSAENKKIPTGTIGASLLRYLHFLILKEIEPRRDIDIVEKMSSFYRRYDWAFQERDDGSENNRIDSFLSQEMETRGIAGKPDDIRFIPVYHWKKLYGYGDIDDTNPFVPFVEQSIADLTIHIRLRNAFIPHELVDSDRSKVYIAAVESGPHSFEGMMVITDALYDALGDEDELRYVLASEYFQAPDVIQHLLLETEPLQELARILAYLATLPCSKRTVTKADLISMFRRVSVWKEIVLAPDAVPDLLSMLGFLSQTAEGTYLLTERFEANRLLLSSFGCCLGCSFWTLDQQKDEYDAITEHFPMTVAQRQFPSLASPETAKKLIAPLLLKAENNPGELSEADREALFNCMMDPVFSDGNSFSLRIADALLADNLTKYEADFIIHADSDEIPEPVLEHIKTRFHSSTKYPAFYYPFALLTILDDEPPFASSLGQELAGSTCEDLKVLGFSVLGTLAKALLEKWDLWGLEGDHITDKKIAGELFALASACHPAQAFYQKMLASLLCAGYIQTSVGLHPQNPVYPAQYRDLWLAEGMGSAAGIYPREYYPLDNFSSFQVRYYDTVYPTAEHAYQAMKFFFCAPEIAELIRTAPSPHAAKKLAETHRDQCQPDWDEWKLITMEDILRVKLHQHSYVQKKLLESGDLPIVEDSPYDYFWGIGFDRTGENHLGKIWMKLRAELRAES